MAKSIKMQAEKQATKVTLRVIQQASETAKEVVASGKQEFLNRIAAAERASETEGRDAFTNLRRLRGEKLRHGEEVVIARHLYAELPLLKQHLRARNMGLGEFCGQYGLTDASESSKELHRLTLSPDKCPKEVRLRRTADKYRRLIEAISKITHESVSTLADRVLRGTSLHPSQQKDGMTETEKLQAALQGIVDKVDSEFGLHAKFVEIAMLKAKHVAGGGKEHWPLWKPSSPCDLSGIYSYLEMPIPESVLQNYERQIADAANPRFAFWIDEAIDPTEYENGFPNPPSTGALQDSEFFYVPHAPLGVIEFANLPRKQNSPGKYEEAVKEQLEWWRTVDEITKQSRVAQEYSISDDWDSALQCPTGQFNYNHHHHRGTDFAWLIIYPTRDGSRLMPMLYIAYQEGGPYILPLDARSLEVFRDAIWLDETRHMSAIDRIKELLGYRVGTSRIIEDGFRRTAPWLDQNPFFKMRQEHANDLRMLDAFCNELWERK